MPIYSFNITVKKTINLLLIFSLLQLFTSSCSAIFEKDISAEKPTLIIPTVNDTLTTNQVHFKWLEMEGAAFYNLQIVQPAFDAIDYFILDSNINAEEFHYVLEPGEYEFRIRGQNGGYKSEYSGPYKFYVDSVSDLSTQFISLVSPINNLFINGYSAVGIGWQSLYAADHYEYVLKIGTDFLTGSILDQDVSISTLSYSIDPTFFNVEGSYFWGIKGVNATSATSFSSRQINVDQTAPNDPSLISPANSSTFALADPITLKWSIGVDPGVVHAPVTSTVEISTDIDFGSFTEIGSIATDSLIYTFPAVGTYYWRVKAKDAVDNVSAFYSTERSLILE